MLLLFLLLCSTLSVNHDCNSSPRPVTMRVQQHSSTTSPSCVSMLDRSAMAACCWAVELLSNCSVLSVEVCVTKQSSRSDPVTDLGVAAIGWNSFPPDSFTGQLLNTEPGLKRGCWQQWFCAIKAESRKKEMRHYSRWCCNRYCKLCPSLLHVSSFYGVFKSTFVTLHPLNMWRPKMVDICTCAPAISPSPGTDCDSAWYI